MKLNKKGSIYWLAKLGNDSIEFDKSDLCTTSKKVFFGLLYSMFIIIIAVVLGMIFGYVPFYMIMWAITGTVLMTEGIIIFLILLVISLIILSGYSIYRVYKVVKKETIKQLESIEFVQTAYKGFKEKVCFLVEVE